MKILVPVKRVVDFNVKVRVKADGSGVDIANVKMSMNPFDEIAVEQAIRSERGRRGDRNRRRVAGREPVPGDLAHGACDGRRPGILVESNAELQPLAVAKLLKAVVAEEAPNLIIMGKQAIDDDCNQTGQMLAALLNWPQATFASKVSIADGNAIVVTREIDGGLETVSMTLPALITTDLRLNEPRYASLPNIMKAKKKPLEETDARDFWGRCGAAPDHRQDAGAAATQRRRNRARRRPTRAKATKRSEGDLI